MTTPYIDPNLIFAENAPVQDKPAAFQNYDKGWDASRTNDGRPLIPQMNYLTQQADLKNLYIHENGAALPYKEGIAYEENAVVVKDGVLQQWKGVEWVLVNSDSQIKTWSGRTQADKNKDFVSVKDYGAIGDGQDHPLSEFFPTLAEAKLKYPFATSLSQTIDYCAHKAAALTGKNIYTPQGDYVFKQPLLLTTVGQVWKGDGIGYGYGSPEFALRDFVPNTRIIAKGTFAKRILTRRNPRTTAAEATDAPMSAVVEVHAMGVELRDFAVWLDCDYTDMSPTNYGADVDIGVFVACQAGFKQNIAILGYFRKVGLYLDVTRQVGLTPLLDDTGNLLPPTTDFAGGDGTILTAPYVRGARVALAVLGAKRGATNQYYDDTQGLVGDYRGSAGFSDFMVIGGRLYAGGHHSGVRFVDPVAPLTRALGEGADDFSPAALYIDGWASNSGSTTTGLGCLRGMVFVNVRFASPEMFRVRLGLCDEINFIGRTWIELGTNSKPVKSTNGTVINANDYATYTYGHIFMHSVNTGNVYAEAPTGGLLTPWANTERYTVRDATGRMRNKAVIIEDSASSMNSNTAFKALLELKDIGDANSNKSGLRVTSYTPSMVLSDRSGGADNDLKLLMDSGIFRIILGNADTEVWDRIFLEFSSNADVMRAIRPLQYPSYTVATLPSPASVGAGTMVYCTDGNSGSPCLAVVSGGAWARIPLGANVSAT